MKFTKVAAQWKLSCLVHNPEAGAPRIRSIHHSRGEHQVARNYARHALASAALIQGPLSGSPTLGIVAVTDPKIHAQLQSIAT